MHKFAASRKCGLQGAEAALLCVANATNNRPREPTVLAAHAERAPAAARRGSAIPRAQKSSAASLASLRAVPMATWCFWRKRLNCCT